MTASTATKKQHREEPQKVTKTNVAEVDSNLPVYTKAEVAKHNTRDDAWCHCNGFVLNVTAFLDSHPGGPETVEEHLGGDIRDAMVDTDHSPYAFTLMKDFIIGTVEGETPVEMFPAPQKQMRGYQLADISNCVDFSKAVLPQVVTLGDKYWPWIINRPVVQKMQMFPFESMEALSRWPWWYIWVLWPPVIAFNLFRIATHEEGYSFIGASLAFFLGVMIWSLTEYILHRFAFHHEVKSNTGNLFHYFMHGVHHLTPTDSSRLTFPPPFAVAIGYLVWILCERFINPEVMSVNGVYAGFALGYLLYDTAHYYFHHSDFNNKLFRICKTSHLGHHYKNEDSNFGVTSPLWDVVFGTYDATNTSSAPAVKDD